MSWGTFRAVQIRALQMWVPAWTRILPQLEPSVCESMLTLSLWIPVCNTFYKIMFLQKTQGRNSSLFGCYSLFQVCRQANRGEEIILWDCETSGPVKTNDTAIALRNPLTTDMWGWKITGGNIVRSFLSFYSLVIHYEPLSETGWDEMKLWSDQILPFLFNCIV